MERVGFGIDATVGFSYIVL